jgi:predicted DNA-binding transcriptional regulator AlpA
MPTPKPLVVTSPAAAAIMQKSATTKEQLALQRRASRSVISTKLEPYIAPSAEERIEALTMAQTTDRVIHEKERAQLTTISRTTWYRLELLNQVPKGGTIGKKKCWMISDIYVYLYRTIGAGVLSHKG